MFGEEGNILISVYSRVLDIDVNYVKDIINKNKIAKIFLKQEPALRVTSDLENLKVLVRATLLREYGDLSMINTEDIEFIDNTYNIKIKPKVDKEIEEYSINKIMKIFEEERNIDEADDTISSILERYDKDYEYLKNNKIPITNIAAATNVECNRPIIRVKTFDENNMSENDIKIKVKHKCIKDINRVKNTNIFKESTAALASKRNILTRDLKKVSIDYSINDLSVEIDKKAITPYLSNDLVNARDGVRKKYRSASKKKNNSTKINGRGNKGKV